MPRRGRRGSTRQEKRGGYKKKIHKLTGERNGRGDDEDDDDNDPFVHDDDYMRMMMSDAKNLDLDDD
jgi:hypothetical protein